MRKFLTISIFFLLLPALSHAEDINAGFVEGLWYSNTPIFEGSPVRIYAAFRNNSESDLTGKIVFKDGNEIIAKKDVSALSGRLVETWADWDPTYGDHTISADLKDVFLHTVGKDPESVTVSNAMSEDVIFVDYDTDGDLTGNEKDKDDDDDGISDEDEIENGTDPLVPNEPEDGNEDSGSKEESDGNNGEDESETDDTEESSDENTEKKTSESRKYPDGFEKFIDEGIVDTVLTSVTEKVIESKDSLDSYREERNEERKNNKKLVDTATLTTTGNLGGLATITRSKVEKEETGIFSSIIDGLLGIFAGLYTLLLWIFSLVLSHPGLVQLLILIGILYVVYKLARRMGGRPQQ